DELNVRMPDFYKEVSLMMDEIPVEDWKAYLKWNVLNRNASYLSGDFEQADFDFFRAYLSGVKEMQPRWKRVMGTTSGFLGEPVGKLYVEKYFPPKAKERMLTLVNNLKKAFGERIKVLDWMGDSTKQKALEKLQTMEVKIGYPDAGDWVDYSPMKVMAGDYLTNIYHGRAFLKRKNLDKIGKPVNKDEWVMPPQTVNAGYIPTYNQIVFPAGILQPPFFFMDADDAVNYGAIGVVIGHEMTHGFDDQGRLFDLHGNLNEWWTEEDSEKFNSKADGFVVQFDRFSILDSLHVNGNLTLGENIADNGGLNISWDACQLAQNRQPQKAITGFTPEQRFFMSYAQIWRQVIRDEELMNHLKEDVHSPGIARVNGALVNIDPFYEAFDIEAENNMFVPKKDRVHVW
ncbi:MAG: M13 family metallopeptidase, partial [Bacteroidales bacterium]|nr:M13 family metallopeptidase [Bacteroidales bacterium]